MVTEKMINDILFESQIGNVDRYSRINIYDSRPYPPQHSYMPPFQTHPQDDIQQRDAMSPTDVRPPQPSYTENDRTPFHLEDYITLQSRQSQSFH